MTQDELKQAVARAALDYVRPKLAPDAVIGIGTGSTANFFIDALAAHRDDFRGCVSSSEASAVRLRQHGITVQMHAAGKDGPGSMKSQFKKADASGARFALVFGADELTQGMVAVKPLRGDAGAQVLRPLDGAAAWAHELRTA